QRSHVRRGELDDAGGDAVDGRGQREGDVARGAAQAAVEADRRRLPGKPRGADVIEKLRLIRAEGEAGERRRVRIDRGGQLASHSNCRQRSPWGWVGEKLLVGVRVVESRLEPLQGEGE